MGSCAALQVAMVGSRGDCTWKGLYLGSSMLVSATSAEGPARVMGLYLDLASRKGLYLERTVPALVCAGTVPDFLHSCESKKSGTVICRYSPPPVGFGFYAILGTVKRTVPDFVHSHARSQTPGTVLSRRGVQVQSLRLGGAH